MIIQQLTPASVRTTRLELYKDPVFLIAHEVVRPKLQSLDLVTLFVSAQNFAAYLMANGIMDEEFLLYELEDVRSELTEHEDYYMFLSIVFIKLCSVAKFNDQAAQTARAIMGYCNEYDGFCDLLKAMDNKEHKLRKENRLTGLLKEELLALTPENVGMEQATKVVEAIVDNCMGLTAESIERILLPIMAVNDQYGHAFNADVDRLKERLGMKTSPQYKELVAYKHVENEIANVEAGAVGVQHNHSN